MLKKKSRSQKKIVWILILAALSITAITALPFIGMELIGINQLLSASSRQRDIFLSLRLPRVLTAFLAGGGLAVCGLVFQAVFRNPMADPYTLGVASGASFGAAAAILFGAVGAALTGIPATAICALCGAALSMVLVLALSGAISPYRPAGRAAPSPHTILLAGIAVSFFFSSLLMFLQYVSYMRESFHIVRWLMGGVDVFGYRPLLTILPFVAVGLILTAANVTALDHFLTGEDIAQTRGVSVRLSRNLLLCAASITVGGIVSACGPICFVGMMIPHLCRGVFGASHKILLPACLMAGGIFLSACDTVARTVIAPAEIPVGVITALLGGPFLVWVSRKRGQGFA
jgi:iron complex transport system permease protein